MHVKLINETTGENQLLYTDCSLEEILSNARPLSEMRDGQGLNFGPFGVCVREDRNDNTVVVHWHVADLPCMRRLVHDFGEDYYAGEYTNAMQEVILDVTNTILGVSV